MATSRAIVITDHDVLREIGFIPQAASDKTEWRLPFNSIETRKNTNEQSSSVQPNELIDHISENSTRFMFDKDSILNFEIRIKYQSAFVIVVAKFGDDAAKTPIVIERYNHDLTFDEMKYEMNGCLGWMDDIEIVLNDNVERFAHLRYPQLYKSIIDIIASNCRTNNETNGKFRMLFIGRTSTIVDTFDSNATADSGTTTFTVTYAVFNVVDTYHVQIPINELFVEYATRAHELSKFADRTVRYFCRNDGAVCGTTHRFVKVESIAKLAKTTTSENWPETIVRYQTTFAAANADNTTNATTYDYGAIRNQMLSHQTDVVNLYLIDKIVHVSGAIDDFYDGLSSGIHYKSPHPNFYTKKLSRAPVQSVYFRTQKSITNYALAFVFHSSPQSYDCSSFKTHKLTRYVIKIGDRLIDDNVCGAKRNNNDYHYNYEYQNYCQLSKMFNDRACVSYANFIDNRFVLVSSMYDRNSINEFQNTVGLHVEFGDDLPTNLYVTCCVLMRSTIVEKSDTKQTFVFM